MATCNKQQLIGKILSTAVFVPEGHRLYEGWPSRVVAEEFLNDLSVSELKAYIMQAALGHQGRYKNNILSINKFINHY